MSENQLTLHTVLLSGVLCIPGSCPNMVEVIRGWNAWLEELTQTGPLSPSLPFPSSPPLPSLPLPTSTLLGSSLPAQVPRSASTTVTI